MNFFKNIQNSIYSPSFYKTVPKKTFWQSIKYFIFLSLFLTAVSLAFLFQTLVIKAPQDIQNFIKDTLNCFPTDLEVKITKGLVSTNVEEPFFITGCGSVFSVDTKDNFKFAVIDTKTDFSASKFREYNTFAWVTKDTVAIKDKDYQTRLYSLKDADNFTLTKPILNSFYNQFSPYIKFVGPILLILVFSGFFIFHLLRLTQLLVTASLVWLLGKIFKNPLNYSSSYKIGLHAATLGLMVDLVVGITSRYTGFFGFPFMFTVTTLGVVVANLFLPKHSSS